MHKGGGMIGDDQCSLVFGFVVFFGLFGLFGLGILIILIELQELFDGQSILLLFQPLLHVALPSLQFCVIGSLEFLVVVGASLSFGSGVPDLVGPQTGVGECWELVSLLKGIALVIDLLSFLGQIFVAFEGSGSFQSLLDLIANSLDSFSLFERYFFVPEEMAEPKSVGGDPLERDDALLFILFLECLVSCVLLCGQFVVFFLDLRVELPPLVGLCTSICQFEIFFSCKLILEKESVGVGGAFGRCLHEVGTVLDDVLGGVGCLRSEAEERRKANEAEHALIAQLQINEAQPLMFIFQMGAHININLRLLQ